MDNNEYSGKSERRTHISANKILACSSWKAPLSTYLPSRRSRPPRHLFKPKYDKNSLTFSRNYHKIKSLKFCRLQFSCILFSMLSAYWKASVNLDFFEKIRVFYGGLMSIINKSRIPAGWELPACWRIPGVGSLPRGVCMGGLPRGESASREESASRGKSADPSPGLPMEGRWAEPPPLPPVNRMTHRYKNITLPQYFVIRVVKTTNILILYNIHF